MDPRYTVRVACRMLGLGEGRIRTVGADDQGRMLPEELAAELGRVEGPVIVCAQARKSTTGAAGR